MRRRAGQLAFAAAVISVAAPVHAASVRRYALVIGNNEGGAETVPLRYARSDAQKIASVLHQLGGFERSDVVVLLDQEADDVRGALADLSARIGAGPGGTTHTTLLVYYSGHAKAGDLRLGKTRMPMSELRRLLAASAADIKLGIVDACEAGSITREKGGRPGPSFLFDAQDLRPSRGLVLITSSAEDESSQESDDLGGSFFTHYLASGLRGDADESGDRRVTLDEIYRYAYNRTVVETSGTRSGIQHPTYSFDLKGNGHLVLTDLSMGRSGVMFGAPVEGHFLIFDLERKVVAAELYKEAGGERRIALPAGRYAIKKRLSDRLRMARFNLGVAGFYAVDEAAMDDVAFEDDYAKGVRSMSILIGGPVHLSLQAVVLYQSFFAEAARAELVPPHALAGVAFHFEPLVAARIGVEVLAGGTGKNQLALAGFQVPYDYFHLQAALQMLWGFRGEGWSILAGPRLAGFYMRRRFPDDPDLAEYSQDHFALSPALAARLYWAFGEDGDGFIVEARGDFGVLAFGVDENRALFYTQAGGAVGYAF